MIVKKKTEEWGFKFSFHLPLFLAFFIFACSQENTITLIVPNAHQVQTNSIVRRNDENIGFIKNLKINNDGEVIIELSLKENIRISRESIFHIVEVDILGNKEIHVESIGMTDFYHCNERIHTTLIYPKMTNKELTNKNAFILIDSLIQRTITYFDSLNKNEKTFKKQR